MTYSSWLLQPKQAARTPNAHLNRIRHLVGTAESWAIVSPERADFPEEHNQRHDEIQLWLRALGLGFKKIKGVWQDTVTKEVSSENSYFIPNIKYNDVIKLMNAYNQQAVIYSGPESEGKIWLIPDSVTNPVDLGKFFPGKSKQDTLYSEVKGKPFTLK